MEKQDKHIDTVNKKHISSTSKVRMLCLGTCAPGHCKRLCFVVSKREKKKRSKNENQVWKILHGELCECIPIAPNLFRTAAIWQAARRAYLTEL